MLELRWFLKALKKLLIVGGQVINLLFLLTLYDLIVNLLVNFVLFSQLSLLFFDLGLWSFFRQLILKLAII
jgi:hypothetical protein